MFSDPLIQFIVTTIISILAATLPFLLYFWKQHQTKEFVYDVTTNTSVLKISDEYKDSLKINYKDTSVQDLKLILIKFANTGNVPIEASHYDQNRPVSITFNGNGAKVLTHDVVDKSPSNMDVNLQVTENRINISPVLLNGGDTFSIKLLVSDFFGDIIVDGRIVGVKAIKEVKIAANQNFRKDVVSGLWAIPKSIGRFIFDLFGRSNAADSSAIIMGIFLIFIALTIAAGFLDVKFLADMIRTLFYK